MKFFFFFPLKRGGAYPQFLGNACASTKVKKFQFLPLEINNQGWLIQKKGDTYSVASSIVRGVKKRVPLAIHQSSYAEVLDKIMAKDAKKGSVKLWKSKKGIWYVLISVSMDVPEPREIKGWIGVDRGQNRIAVASLPQSFGKFWDGRQIKHLRRRYKRIRKALQKAKKRKVIKRL